MHRMSLGLSLTRPATANANGTGVKKYGSFAGDTSWIEIADHDDLSFGDGATDSPFSITARARFDSFGAGTGTIISRVTNTGTDQAEWIMSVDNTGRLQMLLYDSRTENQLKSIATAALSANTWYHVAGTYDGGGSEGGITLYVDGSPVAATESASGTYVAMHNTSIAMRIGAGLWESILYDRWLQGDLYDVKLWDSELSSDNVSYDYNGSGVSGGSPSHRWSLNGNANDLEGSLDGTATNITWDEL